MDDNLALEIRHFVVLPLVHYPATDTVSVCLTVRVFYFCVTALCQFVSKV